MAGVTLRRVSKIYDGGVVAVSDFCLDIPDRSFVSLVGSSGCGKSTTLRMIAGLEAVSSGEICIGGERVNDVPARARDVAMVFQNYALYPHMTVFENIAFSLELRKLPRREIRKRVTEAAEILEVTHLLGRYPAALSGGERQRVALGRAIVRNPKVFLFDEPLSNLDAQLRATMRRELRQLHQRLGSTFIYVTHDQVEAMTMADQIVVMDQGVIQQVAAPQRLYERPANLFAATFIGGMNLFEGRLVCTGTQVQVQFGAGYTLPLTEEMAKNPAVLAWLSRPLIFGLRPTDVKTAGSGHAAWTLTLSVSKRELLGAQANIELKAGDFVLTALLPNQVPVQVGAELAVWLDMGKLHIFDPETEQSILL